MFCDSMMLGGGRQAAFSIANSVRLDGVADYLTRTPSVNGNRKTWTFSAWVKRAKQGLSQPLLRVWNGSSTGDDKYFFISLNPSDKLQITGATLWRLSTPVFRDATAWMHVVVAFDSQAQSIKAYVNGVEITAWDTSTPLALNQDSAVNATYPHYLGDPANPWNGYVAETILVDGAALPPSVFGGTDPVTGSWRPKRISGLDFGTNGFHLDFNDPADLGQDVSGKGNAWTPVSLGAADVVSDTPTNNYPVLNPRHKGGHINLSNGNLSLQNTYPSSGTGNWEWAYATLALPATGKWGYKYKAETTVTSDNIRHYIGAVNPNSTAFGQDAVINSPDVISIYGDYSNGTNVVKWGVKQAGTAPRITSGDEFEALFDCDTGTATFKMNKTQVGSTITGLSLGGMAIFVGNMGAGSSVRGTVDFGQLGYAPSDVTYKPLCTANLPKPAVQSPAKHFDVVTYTGTGTAQSITGLNFAPDLVWIKARSNPTASWYHRLTSRGLTQPNYLSSNSPDPETSTDGNITSLDATGFTVNGGGGVGESGVSHVAWCWKAGGELVANTDGTIASQVSANPTAGFSIVTYAGNGVAGAKVGHGLGAKPKLIIVKPRTGTTNQEWDVYHAALGATKTLQLQTTGVAASYTGKWNDTEPDALAFTLGNDAVMNTDGRNSIAYCWTDVPGYSKFGSYTGNGSTDGPFVYCGFRPRYVLVKNVSAVDEWYLIDTERDDYNPITHRLIVNLSGAESNPDCPDVYATGFKWMTYSWGNVSGHTYIFAAFAEHPLGGEKTTPAKAR